MANDGTGGVSVYSAPTTNLGPWTEIMQLLPPPSSQGMGISIAHGNSVLLVGGHHPTTASNGSVLFYYTNLSLPQFTPVLAYADSTPDSQFGASVAVDTADTGAWVTFAVGAPGVYGKAHVGAVLRPGVTPSLLDDGRALVIARYLHPNFLNTAFRVQAKTTDAFGAAVAVGQGAVACTMPFYRYSSRTTVLNGLVMYLLVYCPPDSYLVSLPPKNAKVCLPCSNGTRSDGFGWTACAECALPAVNASVVWGYRLVACWSASAVFEAFSKGDAFIAAAAAVIVVVPAAAAVIVVVPAAASAAFSAHFVAADASTAASRATAAILGATPVAATRQRCRCWVRVQVHLQRFVLPTAVVIAL